ncbi:E3 ubiquitin-protein ligase RNF126 isoform X9 [Orcinus orca]|uniref:E3 ubiquitin-protein ligase RNF126 isoform X9 n=1 Tax=Orcinus orca TaxID=9733 RepID=UPI002110EAF9|nr:E3 ubiquitin-protein ligase RNF126 isoform X9 [Orcinus orca]
MTPVFLSEVSLSRVGGRGQDLAAASEGHQDGETEACSREVMFEQTQLPRGSKPGLHLPKMRVWLYRGASRRDQECREWLGPLHSPHGPEPAAVRGRRRQGPREPAGERAALPAPVRRPAAPRPPHREADHRPARRRPHAGRVRGPGGGRGRDARGFEPAPPRSGRAASYPSRRFCGHGGVGAGSGAVPWAGQFPGGSGWPEELCAHCLPALPHRPRPQSSFSEGPPPHGHLHLLRCAGPRPDEPSRVQASSGSSSSWSTASSPQPPSPTWAWAPGASCIQTQWTTPGGPTAWMRSSRSSSISLKTRVPHPQTKRKSRPSPPSP